MSVEGQRFGRTPVEDIGGVGVNVRDRVEDADALREERHRMESFVRYCRDTHGGFQSGSWVHTSSVGFCAECASVAHSRVAVEAILGATRVEQKPRLTQAAQALQSLGHATGLISAACREHLDKASKIEQEAYALARATRVVMHEWDNINNPDEEELGRVMDVLESMLDRWDARTQERS